MMRFAVRMQKRLLLGAPLVLMGTAAGHTGGGLVLAGWMLLCRFLPLPRYPYPRKSRLRFARLFFAWAVGFFTLSLLIKLLSPLPYPKALMLPGICCCALLTAAHALDVPMKKRSKMLLSVLLLICGM